MHDHPNMRDNCGVLGVKLNTDAIETLCEGIFQLQHRGQEYCGISSVKNNKIIAQSFKGLVSSNLIYENIGEVSGNAGIAHVSLLDPQPFILSSRTGKFALAFSGNIINADALRNELMELGLSFSSNYDVEILAKLIAKEDSIVDGLKKLPEKVRGSYSLVLLRDDGTLYTMRCPLGIKPLIIGASSQGVAVASESCALRWIGMKIVKDVEPGAIYSITEKGAEKIADVSTGCRAICGFEYAYTARLDSVIDGIPVITARHSFGAKLASNDDIDATVVAGVPMSGLGHALGYHRQSGVPYGIIFNYNRYAYGRSYIPPTQAERIQIASKKLYPVEEAVKGQRIVLCDDSIVRGTQIGNRVEELFDMGAEEVHIRIGAPKFNYGCKHGISTKSQDELIGRKRTEEEVCKILGATSLKYNSVEGFIEALGLPEDDLCLACWTGDYPS